MIQARGLIEDDCVEYFKQIPSFTDYLVSNFGRVKTKSRKIRYVHAVSKKEQFRQSTERFLKLHYNNVTGYKFYQLYQGGKMYNRPAHSLVAEAFLVKPEGADCVNHKDGNKHNNVIDNLEWCTNSYNHQHATITGLKAKGERVSSSRLNEKMVHAIKYLLNKGLSHRDLSLAFKVSRSTITLIANNKIWKHTALTGEELEVNL